LCRAAHERVAQVVEPALDLLHLDLVVGEGRLGDGIPVDEALAAIDQPVAEEPKERLAHGPSADIVHREALPVPIARAAHLLELVGDRGLVLILPRLHACNELRAWDVGPSLAFFFEDALLDNRLRGDARMVCSGHPECLEPHHPVGPGEDILECVIEGVPQVKPGRDIGGRDEQGVGPRLARVHPGGIGVEHARGVPARPDARLMVGRAVFGREGGRSGGGS